MLVVISQETFVPLKRGVAHFAAKGGTCSKPLVAVGTALPNPTGGWPILWPRAALARSRPSPWGQHFQTPHRRDKSSCELFDTTNNFFPELGRPNNNPKPPEQSALGRPSNNPKPPEQSALKILEEAGRRPHGFSASNIINAHIPDAKPAPTDFGTCGGTHQFTTPE